MDLVGALAAWRETKHPAIADALDALAAKIKVGKLPRGGIQLAWSELTPKKGDLTTLLPALVRSVPVQDKVKPYRDNASKTRMSAWLVRVNRLAKFPHDPRIASALAGVIEDPPFEMGDPFTGTWLYQPVLDLIAAIGDTRQKPRLEAVLARPTAKTLNLREYFAKALPPVIAALAKAKLPAIDTARWAAFAPTTTATLTVATPDRDAELIDAVLADPDDEAPRAILGDYWMEKGDPRGELMALQLQPDTDEMRAARNAAALAARAGLTVESDPTTTRIRSITRGDTWLSPDLRRVTKNRTYVRGLLDEITLLGTSAADKATWQRATRDPYLATVRRVRQGDASVASYTLFLTSPALRSVREAELARGSFDLVSNGPLAGQLERLTLDLVDLGMPRFDALSRFPKLSRLALCRTENQLASTQPLVANWTARTRLDAIGVRAKWIGDKRALATWLGCGPALGMAAVFLEDAYDPHVSITLRTTMQKKKPVREAILELDSHFPQLPLSIVALVGAIDRLVIHTTSTGPLVNLAEMRALLERLAPKQLDLPRRWLEQLGR